jgi:hypothetical protein
MTLQLMAGWDDTVAESSISSVGGTSGATGRIGTGLATRRSGTTLSTFLNMPTALSTLYLGIAVKFGSSAAANRFFGFLAPDGTTQHVAVGTDNAGRLTIYGPANTVVATSAAVLVVPSTWNYYEIKIVIHDTTGIVEIRQDEVVVLTYNGDTRNGAATQVQFISNASPVSSTDFDDCWIDDAGYLGDKTVIELAPTGDGDSSG